MANVPTAPNPKSSSMMRRVILIEDRIDNLREHINLIENNFIDRNKELAKEMREVNEKISDLRSNLIKMEESMSQILEKFEEFATKEQVKVLERYLYFLNPLDYVTKKEVNNLLGKDLEENNG